MALTRRRALKPIGKGRLGVTAGAMALLSVMAVPAPAQQESPRPGAAHEDAAGAGESAPVGSAEERQPATGEQRAPAPHGCPYNGRKLDLIV